MEKLCRKLRGAQLITEHIKVMKIFVNDKVNTNNVVAHSNGASSILPNLFARIDENEKKKCKMKAAAVTPEPE